MRVYVPLFLFTSLLAAQTVEVEVYDSVTGAPVAGAYVTENAMGAANAPVSRTDVAGHFRSTLPDAGINRNLSLIIARAGYLWAYRSVMPQSNQSLTVVRIPLTPAAVISGKLVDEDGFPVDRASVQAVTYRLMDGKRRLVPVASVSSNDLGEYRLTGLSAASYHIWIQSSNARNWDERYVSQFIDGGLQPGDKNLVEVKAGQEHSGVDGKLRMYEGVTVAGRVVVPEGAAVSQTHVDLNVPNSSLFDFFAANTQTDGSFQFRHVPPGSYILRARTSNQTNEIHAGDLLVTSPLEVETSDVTGLVLTPHVVQPIDLAGTVVQQGGGTPQAVLVVARGTNGEGASAHSAEDGSFVLKGLLPGHYSLRVQPDYQAIVQRAVTTAASPFTFPSSARLGEQEVLETGFAIDSAPAGPLQITMKLPIRITGQVVDSAGNPVPGANLLAFSDQGPQGAGVSDEKGTFQMTVRTAGDYRILATTDRTSSYDLEYLKAHEKDSQALRIVEGQNPPVTVRLPAQ
jgi:hypothetical protein